MSKKPDRKLQKKNFRAVLSLLKTGRPLSEQLVRDKHMLSFDPNQVPNGDWIVYYQDSPYLSYRLMFTSKVTALTVIIYE